MGPPQGVLHLHRAFMQPSEAQGPKVQIPLAVIDLGETDVFLAPTQPGLPRPGAAGLTGF
ncbi:MAG: hypothetical protein H0X69_09065 [Gemmatimonadales bacterium]|nr:hypothetical protein [Gemmatimonadales bacterium]